MGVVEGIDSDILQWFAFRADIGVLLGHVGELINAIETSRPIGIFFYPDVSRDATLLEPLQKFAVSVGGIRGQSLRQIA